jgi:hypothetical protein
VASSSVVAGRFQSDDDADLAEAVGNRAVDIGTDQAGRDLELRDAAQVMFSPIVAMALATASLTVPPPG